MDTGDSHFGGHRINSTVPKLIKKSYDASLNEASISKSLEIDIKQFFGNLRSVLDYLAKDIYEVVCKPGEPGNINFPIRENDPDFTAFMKQFANLEMLNKEMYDYLRSVQPYQSGSTYWLRQFNSVNNELKHNILVPQTKEISERISVKFGGGSVDWNPAGVTLGHGVCIGGVPVNPSTQLPVPNSSQKVSRTVWVDFRFEGTGVSALLLMEQSLQGVTDIYKNIYSMIR